MPTPRKKISNNQTLLPNELETAATKEDWNNKDQTEINETETKRTIEKISKAYKPLESQNYKQL